MLARVATVVVSLLAVAAMPATAAPSSDTSSDASSDTSSDVAAPVADDRATKDDYALDTSGTSAALKVNADGTFALKITPKNGKKVHPDAPLEVVIADNAAVKPAKLKLGRGDLVEKGAKEPEVKTALKAMKAGATTLDVTVSFFLCTDAWCQRMSDKVQVAVTVEE